MYFRIGDCEKSLLEISLKSTVSEQALSVNMWKRPNCLWNLHESGFLMFFMILREVHLENVSSSGRWNLRSFVNTLTAESKCPVQGFENLQLQIEGKLSEKRKYFSEFFVPFLDSTSNFEHFERKVDHHN